VTYGRSILNLYSIINKSMGLSQADTIELLKGQDETTKELFRLMLCPSVMFFIKKLPEPEPCAATGVHFEEHLLECIQRILSSGVRGNALKDSWKHLISACTLELQEVCKWIIARKNPAKIGKSTVNKAWPGLIRTQRYMGAVPGTPENLERLPWSDGVAVQDKEDGLALLVDYKNGESISMHTRQGQDITQYFPMFLKGLPFVLGFNGMVHHELFVYDTEAEELLDRKTGNGLINKQVKNGKVGGSIDQSLRSVILDFVDDNWPNTPESVRWSDLIAFENPQCTRVNEIVLYDLPTARMYAQELIKRGKEGVICKDRSGLFKNGKPWYNVKIKNEFTVDLIIVDTKEHSKDPELIGSVLCESSDGLLSTWVNLRCDTDREHPDHFYRGAIVQVKAESIIRSKTKKTASLYLPRMDGNSWNEYHRFDKDSADSYKYCKQKEEESRS